LSHFAIRLSSRPLRPNSLSRRNPSMPNTRLLAAAVLVAGAFTAIAQEPASKPVPMLCPGSCPKPCLPPTALCEDGAQAFFSCCPPFAGWLPAEPERQIAVSLQLVTVSESFFERIGLDVNLGQSLPMAPRCTRCVGADGLERIGVDFNMSLGWC